MKVVRYDMETEYNRFACEDQVVEIACADGEYVKHADYEILYALYEDLLEHVENAGR